MRDQDDVIIVPINTASKILFGKDYIDQIWVEVTDTFYVEKAMEDIPKLMRDIMNVPQFKEDPVTVFNLSDIKKMLTQTTKTFSLLIGIIAGISLIVGGIGIMNIMLVSVVERTKEIGLRKAIGATNRAVLLQFLIEAVILSVLGGVIGILLGSGAAFVLGKFTGWSIYVSLIAVIMSFSFSFIVGVVFGFWPAKKASRLEPIEALRYE
jgi:ABC-type antimicrobial peptide transport system permease subunit